LNILEIGESERLTVGLGGSFRQHGDLLREGDEARVFLVGAREAMFTPPP